MLGCVAGSLLGGPVAVATGTGVVIVNFAEPCDGNRTAVHNRDGRGTGRREQRRRHLSNQLIRSLLGISRTEWGSVRTRSRRPWSESRSCHRQSERGATYTCGGGGNTAERRRIHRNRHRSVGDRIIEDIGRREGRRKHRGTRIEYGSRSRRINERSWNVRCRVSCAVPIGVPYSIAVGWGQVRTGVV